MPQRGNKVSKAAEQPAEGLKFTRTGLESFSDLDLKGVLRMVNLDEYTENFDRAVAIDRILQEQRHGFTVANQEVLDRFLEKASQAVEPSATVSEKASSPKEQKRKTHTTEKGTGDEEGLLVAGERGSVTYSIREVKNLGNYETLQLNVSVTLPFNPTDDEIKAAKSTLAKAKELCVEQLENDMKELGL